MQEHGLVGKISDPYSDITGLVHSVVLDLSITDLDGVPGMELDVGSILPQKRELRVEDGGLPEGEFIHSFNIFLQSAHYVPGTVLCTKDTAVKKEAAFLLKFASQRGRQATNELMINYITITMMVLWKKYSGARRQVCHAGWGGGENVTVKVTFEWKLKEGSHAAVSENS